MRRLLVARAAEAADVYEDAVIAGFEKLSGFHGSAAFGHWLCRIAVRCTLMLGRATVHDSVQLAADPSRFDWIGRHVQAVRDWEASAAASASLATTRSRRRRASACWPPARAFIGRGSGCARLARISGEYE